jgi:hypothetical protein
VCQHCGGGEGLGIPCSYSLINGNNKCEGCARNKRPAKKKPKKAPKKKAPKKAPKKDPKKEKIIPGHGKNLAPKKTLEKKSSVA